MSFGQRMNMCNITFIVSSFGIFRHYKIFCVNEKYGSAEISGSNIEYNPKFLSKIKKALEFQCLIVIFISTGSSNLDDRFSH